jgi:hypothetical protein
LSDSRLASIWHRRNRPQITAQNSTLRDQIGISFGSVQGIVSVSVAYILHSIQPTI